MTEETTRKICALNAQTYSRIAQKFSDTRTRPWDEFTPLKKFLKDGMSVLDIGCGNGRLLSSFPKDIQFEYTGVDVSMELIQEAKRIYMKDSYHQEFFVGDILSLRNVSEIQGKEYDAVSAIAVLNHIPSRELQTQVFSEMKAFLKPDGMLFLTNWNLLQIGVRKSVWRYKWEQFCMSNTEWQKMYGFSKKELGFRDSMTTWKSGRLSEPLYYYSFTLGELARLCRAAGFRVEDVYYSKEGRHAHWWDGRNSVVLARKV